MPLAIRLHKQQILPEHVSSLSISSGSGSSLSSRSAFGGRSSFGGRSGILLILSREKTHVLCLKPNNMEGLNTHSSSGPRGYFEKSGRSVHEYYFRICAMPTTFRNNFALLIDSKSMDGAILRRLGNFSFTNCLCLMM